MSESLQTPILAPGVKDFMLDPKFWIKQKNNLDKPIINEKRKKNFIEESYKRASSKNLKWDFCNIEEYPSTISKGTLFKMMEDYSDPEKFKNTDYYNIHGELVSKKSKEEIIELTGFDYIPDKIRVRFGLIIKRVDVRAFPSDEVFAKKPETIDQDMFQLTALSVGTPVAILHMSKNSSWCFVQASRYRGWVKSEYIAPARKRGDLYKYLDKKEKLVVIDSRIETEPNPFKPKISNIGFQMGDDIPLVDDSEIPESIPSDNLQAQSPEGCYVISLPVKDKEGYLKILPALIARSQGVNEGYLSYTRKNLIKQSFKLLGERYGWGGLFNRRDCSRFIMDIYRSVGLQIPRDAGQPQEKIPPGKVIEFRGTVRERKEKLKMLDPGDPIYMKGHVVMYLGDYNGDYYVIHAGSGYGKKEAKDKIQPITVHGVFVMKVDQYMKSGEKKYIEAFKLARKFG